MSSTPAIALPDETGTPATARVVPTAAMPVRISVGDWIDQALSHNEPEIAAVVQAGARAAASTIPFGSLILGVFGPKLIDDYVLIGVNYVRSIVAPMGIDVSSGHPYMSAIATMINNSEARFAAFAGDMLHPMIEAGLTKAGIAVAPGYVPSAFPYVKNPSGAIGGD